MVIRFPSKSPWREETAKHAIEFEPHGDVLLVTFDHHGSRFDPLNPPKPWAHSFATKNNLSILGISSKRHVWFREISLFDTMSAISESGFFNQFRRVVFAGGSMGGYGALAFSSLCPGATVIAINPQSSLHIDLVPWEHRYRKWKWGKRFRDGAEECFGADRVYLLYDPFYEPDRRHADRILANDNVVPLKCWGMEHGIATSMTKIDILKQVMEMMIADRFDERKFYRLLRRRKLLERYPQNLAMHLNRRELLLVQQPASQ